MKLTSEKLDEYLKLLPEDIRAHIITVKRELAAAEKVINMLRTETMALDAWNKIMEEDGKDPTWNGRLEEQRNLIEYFGKACIKALKEYDELLEAYDKARESK